MTTLGIAGGEQGKPSKLKICRVRAGPNVITGANPHLNRKSGSWSPDTPKSAYSGLMAVTLTTVLHYRADCDSTGTIVAAKMGSAQFDSVMSGDFACRTALT